jgi:hypothetical protein
LSEHKNLRAQLKIPAAQLSKLEGIFSERREPTHQARTGCCKKGTRKIIFLKNQQKTPSPRVEKSRMKRWKIRGTRQRIQLAWYPTQVCSKEKQKCR